MAADPKGLFAWYSAQEEHPYVTPAGEQLSADITLIDQGWKEESWNIQPLQQFCGQVGFNNFIPSKGEPNYRRPADSPNILIGDNWHVTFRGGIPLVMTNANHWKLKVHEGLLLEAGQPGALTLFNPQRIEGRRNQTGHLSFAKHLLSETWETRHKPGFGGSNRLVEVTEAESLLRCNLSGQLRQIDASDFSTTRRPRARTASRNARC